MDFLAPELQAYVEEHTTPEPSLLQQINRETYLNVLHPRMLSGHLQGRILATLSRMIKPNAVLEIGTFTGYSALCLAEGLQPGGKLITIDINEELEKEVRQYFETAGATAKIEYLIGNAVDLVPKISDELDLVFIDADKTNYKRYYEMVMEKVKPGGYILADNVLWSGKVLNTPEADDDTKAIIDFNCLVHQDPRVENVLFPVRDGLMVLRKL